MRTNIVVSGIPASGKSTVGTIISTRLNMEFLDKDAILESLFESKGIGDAEWRSRLSREADEILRERALQSEGAVIVSWWRHPLSNANTGTATEWLSGLGGRCIEVYCVCDPAVAAERFARRKRHAGHLDQNKNYAELNESFEKHAQLGPLGLGALIKVATDQKLDENRLTKELQLLIANQTT